MKSELKRIDWGALDHAYGSASDIPWRLQAISENPCNLCRYDEEPWGGLWSRLSHQGDVYSASIESVPFIIASAIEAMEEGVVFTWAFIALPIAIETNRKNSINLRPTSRYFIAIKKINELIEFLRDKNLPSDYEEVLAEASKVLEESGFRNPPQQKDLPSGGLFDGC